MSLIELTQAWFIWPTLSLLAGLWALAPLGRQVLQRQVVFLDLALAQACAAAALWAGAWLHWHEPWQTQAVAALGAVADDAGPQVAEVRVGRLAVVHQQHQVALDVLARDEVDRLLHIVLEDDEGLGREVRHARKPPPATSRPTRALPTARLR